jgi:hypothetical protein
MQVFLCAFGFNFAPLRENPFSQRRKVKTEGAKEDRKLVLQRRLDGF